MQERHTLETNLNSLKKSIPVWITGLQGTGNLELNQVVNELHTLNHDAYHPTADSANIRQQASSLYQKVQMIQSRHGEPYRSHLKSLAAELAKFKS